MSNRRDPVLPDRKLEDLSLDTVAVVVKPKKYTGKKTIPLATPICHSSTFKLEKVDDFLEIMSQGGEVYSRLGNSTTDAAECLINSIEGGAGSLVYASGMAAISTVLISYLNSGDHIIVQNPVYSNTLVIIREFQKKYGIDVTIVPAACNITEYRKNIKANTKILMGETPCNPCMTILDLEAFGKLGQEKDILTVVDATFGSCYLQQPIAHGVDISIHSCTKYMGGHSDLTGGCVTTRTLQQWKIIKKWSATLGGIMSPHDASLLIRGLKTLPIRMEKHSQNGKRIAEYLELHPKIDKVFYPGLPSHPQHDIAKKQMKSFGGMLRADVKGGEQGGRTLVESLNIVSLAVSLGGVESIIEQPYTMTHGPYLYSQKEIDESGFTPGTLRISIGLEDVDDLIKDFQQALEKVKV
ncbi:hypothetical protein LOTGIDRAFT_217598 [Lottia gigantea]|uniref:plant cystathionine gamma-synthase n=1 Tax=Lottia gigantea TaxID=225164 RepID=V4BQB7_LOTGI|nr:hypothetical protein LOTGIDRAFT_217598 [Lottia gigantea]ESO91064.1 hypothetical protein LOTGIDRAFT_217598 [Lottia gigantea]